MSKKITEPIEVVKGGYNGGKTVAESLGNTEHRQNVLAEMQNMGMSDAAGAISKNYGITAPAVAPAASPTATPTASPGITPADGSIEAVDKFYNDQIKATNDRANAMMLQQQQATDFTIKQIEQNKAQAEKDFEKEKNAAYVDYQKEINPYGVNAETLAAQGMSGTGYAESSRVRMYTAYQQRVATARETVQKAILSFNNSITEARLQNSAAMAQLAFDTLEKSLALSIEGFRYKNELLDAQYMRKWNEDEREYQRGQDKISLALQKLELGDYSGIKDLGWNIDYNKLNQSYNNEAYEKQLNYAVTAAKYGDFKPLEDLGIVVSDAYKQSYNNSAQPAGLYVFGDTEPEITNPISLNTVVKTDFYKGTVNPDVQYGAFKTKDSNDFAYQPDNIGGVKLTDTGDTFVNPIEFKYGSKKGQKDTKTQKIWSLPDGTLWYWEGTKNKYLPFPPAYVAYEEAIEDNIIPTQRSL